MKLRLQSEKRSPEGGINGSGARRMMGRPEMAPLTLSIREAIQNSWDQRLQNGSTTTISFDWRSCSPAEDRFLREFVFQEWPSEGLSPLPEDTFSLLVISDRNTKGLNGPLFADEYEAGETDFNFVRFFDRFAFASRLDQLANSGLKGCVFLEQKVLAAGLLLLFTLALLK